MLLVGICNLELQLVLFPTWNFNQKPKTPKKYPWTPVLAFLNNRPLSGPFLDVCERTLGWERSYRVKHQLHGRRSCHWVRGQTWERCIGHRSSLAWCFSELSTSLQKRVSGVQWLVSCFNFIRINQYSNLIRYHSLLLKFGWIYFPRSSSSLGCQDLMMSSFESGCVYTHQIQCCDGDSCRVTKLLQRISWDGAVLVRQQHYQQ